MIWPLDWEWKSKQAKINLMLNLSLTHWFKEQKKQVNQSKKFQMHWQN